MSISAANLSRLNGVWSDDQKSFYELKYEPQTQTLSKYPTDAKGVRTAVKPTEVWALGGKGGDGALPAQAKPRSGPDDFEVVVTKPKPPVALTDPRTWFSTGAEEKYAIIGQSMRHVVNTESTSTRAEATRYK